MSDNARPTIPAGEFDDRRRRLRERMAAENLDVFIAYSDDRATYGQQHARYLFNYQPHFEPALTVVRSKATLSSQPDLNQKRS